MEENVKKEEGSEAPKKGVVLQFFGVVLLSLGMLNAMMALKGVFEPDAFHFAMIGFGLICLFAGIWRSRETE